MKIIMKNNELFLIHLYNDYSGSPLVLKNLINASNEKKFHLFTSRHDGFLSNLTNCKYVFLSYKYNKNKLISLIYFIFSQLELFIKLTVNLLIYRIKGHSCTVIINTMLPFSASIAGFLFANRTIYYIHETHIRPNILKKLLLFCISKFSDEVIYVSKYTKETLKLKNKNSIIPNPLRNDLTLISNTPPQKKHNRKSVIFCGSLKEHKGILNLIKISEKCQNINFILALNCDKKEFDAFTQKYSYLNNIESYHRPNFLGSLYDRSFIVLNLSIPECSVETFGLSILEGISFGCVPIVPPEGGPLEIIEPNFGYSIHSNNIEAISDIINELSSDYDQWYTKSELAIKRSKEFSFSKYKESINNILGI